MLIHLSSNEPLCWRQEKFKQDAKDIKSESFESVFNIGTHNQHPL